MLLIEDLQVELAGKQLLKHIDLEIKPGETHILFGPNGSGKTSLLMTLMGMPGYKVTAGKIVFKGQDITHMPIHERAQLGLAMAFQRPPTINGLKTRQMVSICGGHRELDIEDMARQVNFDAFLDRDVNAGLSGGEIKRSELLQLMAQDADLMLFDEPESGVDLENMHLVGETIAHLLQKDSEVIYGNGKRSIAERRRGRVKMGLIITHTGYILDYLEADAGHVLFKGVLSCASNPREILRCIGQNGYEECVACMMPKGPHPLEHSL
ncbi:ABC transporter ATP-binding protein [Desulfocarbo indianensis]|nr:ABC transporter ATP-binding protein [Desulfocarbo indianensis]